MVDGIGFHIEAGVIACLLGPSGCGKTTLLRCIAGFEDIAAGSIALDGELVSRPGFKLAPEQRRIGMVFQDYALFPHLTVADNIAFGLKTKAANGCSGWQPCSTWWASPARARSILTSFPAASSSASPWPGPWPRRPAWCCWTSPSPTWTWTCASASPWKCARS